MIDAQDKQRIIAAAEVAALTPKKWLFLVDLQINSVVDMLVRLGPGRYQLGELGKRLHCRIDNGRLLTQPEEPLEGGPEDQLPPPVEFSKFISEMFTG
ncbi:unnamed protein product [Symbiodinium sp. CCMP2592]|nr:unnamed protein product [Symbiodinium sp. CCMP2592]